MQESAWRQIVRVPSRFGHVIRGSWRIRGIHGRARRSRRSRRQRIRKRSGWRKRRRNSRSRIHGYRNFRIFFPPLHEVLVLLSRSLFDVDVLRVFVQRETGSVLEDVKVRSILYVDPRLNNVSVCWWLVCLLVVGLFCLFVELVGGHQVRPYCTLTQDWTTSVFVGSLFCWSVGVSLLVC